jgi:hypothetical protein
MTPFRSDNPGDESRSQHPNNETRRYQAIETVIAILEKNHADHHRQLERGAAAATARRERP